MFNILASNNRLFSKVVVDLISKNKETSGETSGFWKLSHFAFTVHSKSRLLENGFLNYLQIVLWNRAKHKITSLKMLIYSAVNLMSPISKEK